MKKELEIFNNQNIHNILRSSGYVRDPQDVNVLEIFYSIYNKIPLVTDMGDLVYFNWTELYSSLKKEYPNLNILYENKQISFSDNVIYYKQQTLELKEGLVLVLEGAYNNINNFKGNYLDINQNISNKINYANYVVFLSTYDMNDEYNDIISLFNKCKIEEEESINIGMVSMENGSYYVKDFDIRNSIIDLELLDLHYGVGFEDFNSKLIERLLNKSKGLTLLHGEPGTGKCVIGDTIIKIRNKKTGEISEINIEDLM